MTEKEILKKLKSFSSASAQAGMARFGIKPAKCLGVQIPVLRRLAKEVGKNHRLARQLWNSGIHEAKILASMVADHKLIDSRQMDNWVKDFDSWDVCDQTCLNLFCRAKNAFGKCRQWGVRKEEFVKRAGFALMACLAWQDKSAPDSEFQKFFPIILRQASDERNYVRKAVNWALRQIGKRNKALNKSAIREAEKISKMNSKSARWIAVDALRELKSKAVQNRLKDKRQNQ